MTENADKGPEGFTLVELLVALAITAAITTFAIGALMLSLRAFEVSRRGEVSLEAFAGPSRLTGLIEKAWPATGIDTGTGLARLLFDGRHDALDFATLSEGYGLEGGIVRVWLGLGCKTASEACCLELLTAIHRSDPKAVSFRDPVILARDVSSIQLRYFGTLSLAEAPRWHDEWRGMDRLPQAVSIYVGFADADKPDVPLLIPLHHASR